MAVPARPAARLQIFVMAPDGRRPRAAGLASWLRLVAPRTARGELTVALVSDRRMRSLNRSFRGVDRATDVLSFPAFATVASPRDATKQCWFVRPASGPHVPDRRAATASARSFGPASGPRPLGDIVIATGVAARQAAAAGHTMGTELRVLALHGLLHLLGFDHERDGGAMARTELRLRRRGRLREGLIERAAPAGRPRARR